MPQDSGTANQLEAIIKGTGVSITKLEQIMARADSLYKSLPAERRVFFNDNLRTQAGFMLHLNETLNAVTRAFMTLETGAGPLTINTLTEATGHLQDARNALGEAAHGKFSGWYDSDTKFKMDGLEERIGAVLTSLEEGSDNE